MALQDLTPDEAVVPVHGQIDAYTAAGIDGIVTIAREAGHRSLVLDFSEVTFLDSSGLRAIVRAQRNLAAVGCHMVIRHPTRAVRRVLELTGVDALLELRD